VDRALVQVMRRRLERRRARPNSRTPQPAMHPSDVAFKAELLAYTERAQQLILETIVPALRERFDAEEDDKDHIKRSVPEGALRDP
jgi:hypothetical protein